MPARPAATVDLPWSIKRALERTPRSQWHRIRALALQSPEAAKLADLTLDAEYVIPRSTLAVRRKLASAEERAMKAQEMAENVGAFWAAVESLQQALARMARAADLNARTLPEKKPGDAVA